MADPNSIEAKGAAFMASLCATRAVKVLKYLNRGVPATVPRLALDELEKLPSSVLAQALGTTTIEVSSFHHQAIDRVGDGLEVVARSAVDGLPEAVELPGRPVLAVQWELQEEWRVDARFGAVFDWFVGAASDFGAPPGVYESGSPKSRAGR